MGSEMCIRDRRGSQYLIVLQDLTVLIRRVSNESCELTVLDRPARTHITKSSCENSQYSQFSRDSMETLQRHHRGSTETLRRYYRELTEILHGLYRDSAETPHRLCRDSIETPQKLHIDSAETPEILQRLSGDSHRIVQWFHNQAALQIPCRDSTQLGQSAPQRL